MLTGDYTRLLEAEKTAHEGDILLEMIFNNCELDYSGKLRVYDGNGAIMEYIKAIAPNDYQTVLEELKTKKEAENV